MAHGGGPADRRDEVVRLAQRMSVEGQHVAHAFAAAHGLHQTDLEALLHVLHADAAGRPTTAGGLAAALGVTSGAATGVIDRLVRAGHVDRRRDEADRRKVVLHYAAHGRAMAEEFFAPLGALTDEVLAGFDAGEIDAVVRFLTQMTEAMARHGRAR